MKVIISNQTSEYYCDTEIFVCLLDFEWVEVQINSRTMKSTSSRLKIDELAESKTKIVVAVCGVF
jgi:hypothetical protein